jgi:hypothetical protein
MAFTSAGTGDSSAVMMQSNSLSTNVRKRVARNPESIDHSAATSRSRLTTYGPMLVAKLLSIPMRSRGSCAVAPSRTL